VLAGGEPVAPGDLPAAEKTCHVLHYDRLIWLQRAIFPESAVRRDAELLPSSVNRR
jgi:hypothetical protein